MRVTIIPVDGFVSKDDAGYSDLVFTVDPAVHAVQWYDTWGEVEYKVGFDGASAVKPQNSIISDMSEFQPAIDAWQVAKDTEVAAIEAARIAIADTSVVVVNPDALPA